MEKKVLIKGAGDLATGIACRLYNCGFQILMTEIQVPTTVRRTVAFSRAVYEGEAVVEGIRGVLCKTQEEIDETVEKGMIAVTVDETWQYISTWKPDIVVDAILAKRNLGTSMSDAPIVIGAGPGFEAGQDCHCVIETKRGHDLGRCLWKGCAKPNTGIPGMIGGYGKERLIKAPCNGWFTGTVSIGDQVEAGGQVGWVVKENQERIPVRSAIKGVVRGLLQDGVAVTEGMKSGDVDPRDVREHCFTVSDKARAIGGGVLEAILTMERRKELER